MDGAAPRLHPVLRERRIRHDRRHPRPAEGRPRLLLGRPSRRLRKQSRQGADRPPLQRVGAGSISMEGNYAQAHVLKCWPTPKCRPANRVGAAGAALPTRSESSPPSESPQSRRRIELGAPDRSENDAKWALEAEAQIDAYDCGNIAAMPADVVFEKIERTNDYRREDFRYSSGVWTSTPRAL